MATVFKVRRSAIGEVSGLYTAVVDAGQTITAGMPIVLDADGEIDACGNSGWPEGIAMEDGAAGETISYVPWDPWIEFEAYWKDSTAPNVGELCGLDLTSSDYKMEEAETNFVARLMKKIDATNKIGLFRCLSPYCSRAVIADDVET